MKIETIPPKKFFKKNALLEVIQLLNERNKNLLDQNQNPSKTEFRTICIKIGENNNTINSIEKLIEKI